MPARMLIINADDFGWSGSVNSAVAKAYEFGTITSASLMTCGQAVFQAAEICREQKGLGVGLHFTLTQGRPLSPSPKVGSLCDSSGAFFSRTELIRRLFSGRVRKEHIRIELDAQVRIADELGLSLTHIDGHQHIHILPGITGPVLSLAKRRNLAVRLPLEQKLISRENASSQLRLIQLIRKALLQPFCYYTRFKSSKAGILSNTHFRSHFGYIPAPGRVSLDSFLGLLTALRPGVTELMVHPAVNGGDSELWGENPSLRKDRRYEAEILLDARFKEALRNSNIRLINYGEL